MQYVIVHYAIHFRDLLTVPDVLSQRFTALDVDAVLVNQHVIPAGRKSRDCTVMYCTVLLVTTTVVLHARLTLTDACMCFLPAKIILVLLSIIRYYCITRALSIGLGVIWGQRP